MHKPLLNSFTKSQTICLFDKWFYRTPTKSLRRKLFSVILFIAASIVLAFIMTIILGSSPAAFFRIFTRLFSSSVNNVQRFIYQIAVFSMAALAFSFCMNVGIFNIGVSGQMLAGASLAFFVIDTFPSSWKQIEGGGQIVTLLLGMIGAAIVALLTGLLKIYLKVNEVVSAVLLNWIILFIVGYLTRSYLLDFSQEQLGFFRSRPMPFGFAFFQPGSGFTKNSGWVWSIAVTVVAIMAVWFVMKFTVFGHKLKTTGLSFSSAQYFGYNHKGIQLSSFLISGLLAGALGVIVYTGTESWLNFDSVGRQNLNSVPVEGFNGIAIGLIALNNPFGIFAVSVIFAFINVGAQPAGLPINTISLVTGIMMYVIAIHALANYLRPWRWFYLLKYRKVNSANYLHYENMMSALAEKRTFEIVGFKNELIDNYVKMKFGNTKKSVKKVLTYVFAKTFYCFLFVYFSKAYNVKKAEINQNFLQSKKQLVIQMQLGCIKTLINDWQDKIMQSKNHNQPRLSYWLKDKKLIYKWGLKIRNEEFITQTNQSISKIDNWFIDNVRVQHRSVF